MTRWKFCAGVGLVGLIALPFQPVLFGVCMFVILIVAANSSPEEKHWWER